MRWRAPLRFVVARMATSLTSKPALRSRLENDEFGPDDQTASTPPVRSARRIAFNPFRSYSASLALRIKASGPLSTSSRIASNADWWDRTNSTTSASRMSARGSVRQSPKMAAIGPRAQAITAGTSSATTMRASLPSTASAARSVNPMPNPPISKCGRLTVSILLAGKRSKRLLGPAETAVHQLVLAQHHREFVTPSHQAKFDVGARHACGIDLQPRNHAMHLRGGAGHRQPRHQDAA